jgi:transposase-like protein
MACFVLGMSTRKVSTALLTLLGERISATTVSEVAKRLDEAVKRHHERQLKDTYVSDSPKVAKDSRVVLT